MNGRYAGWFGLLFAAALFGCAPLHADDESDELQVVIEAPLEALDCEAQTITILGLSVDVSQAEIQVEGRDEDDEEADTVTGADDAEEEEEDSSGCADLVVGATVRVVLTGSQAPLAASEVHQDMEDADEGEGDDEESQGVSIQAPLEAVDCSEGTVTVLGLTVDISQAEFEGHQDDWEEDEASEEHQGEDETGTAGTADTADTADDADDADGEDEEDADALDCWDLAPGQWVRMELYPDQLPELSACYVEIFNFGNQVQLEVSGFHGQPLSGDDNVVTCTVTVKTSVRANGQRRRLRRTVSLQRSGNGRMVLAGLPTGVAALKVQGTSNGVSGQAVRRLRVRGDRKVRARMRLRPLRRRRRRPRR